MVRVLKRYGSRKLYDTEASRYATLEELVGWIRDGQQVRVVDNESGEDVTAQTLTQVILDQGRRGGSFLNIETLHEVIRRGEETMRVGVERLLEAGLDRLGPVRKAREEMAALRDRIDELEKTLVDLEGPGGRKAGEKPPRRRAPRGKPDGSAAAGS